MIIRCQYDKLVPIIELKSKFHPKNRNKHPQEQIDRLIKILKYQGTRSPARISKLSGLMTAGHGRVLAAEKAGWTSYPVNFQEYENEDMEIADLTADNAIASWSELDLAGINLDVGDLGPDFDVDLLGIRDFKIDVSEKVDSESQASDGNFQDLPEDKIPDKIEPRVKPAEVYTIAGHTLYNGDCLKVLKSLQSDSLDALVTDPPAGISFMGKEWDDDKGGSKEWIKWMREVMKEALRVLKPGAHGLVWAIPRTSHWTATALEDAGFEIRDVVTHIFGSGFPKSMNISIAIDKQLGAMEHRGKAFVTAGRGDRWDIQDQNGKAMPVHEPSTPEAKQWQGWGTGLKPSVERWLMIRKPFTTVPLDIILRDICHKFYVKFAGLNSELSPKELEGEFDFVQWPVALQTITRSLEKLEKMDMSKSLGMDTIISNIVRLWNAFLDVVCDLPSKSIIEIETGLITDLKILNCLISLITPENIIQVGMKDFGNNSNAKTVELLLNEIQTQLLMLGRHFVLENASTLAGFFAKQTKEVLGLGKETRSVGWSEDFILIRKPCSEDTVAENVLKHGTGGINIDGSRTSVDRSKEREYDKEPESGKTGGNKHSHSNFNIGLGVRRNDDWLSQGRFPANLILSHNPDCVEVGTKKVKPHNGGGYRPDPSKRTPGIFGVCGGDTNYISEDGTETVAAWECTEGCPVRELDLQSGVSKSNASGYNFDESNNDNPTRLTKNIKSGIHFQDSGGASRFFKCFQPTRFAYIPKPSKREKNEGCEELQKRESQSTGWSGDSMPLRQDGTERKTPKNFNIHPTVKSTKLMSYLIKMITPPDGTLLDCFGGSGTTMIAAHMNQFKSVLIEQSTEYCDIILARAEHITEKSAVLNG